MYISKDAAQKRAEAARSRLEAAQKRAEVAAQKQATWQIWGFFADHTPAAWGAFWYFLVSSSGATYSLALYQQFEINIFNFFSTSDFLLSAFRTPTTLIIGVIATLLVIFIPGYLAYNSIIYRSIGRIEQQSLVRRETKGLLFISIFILILLVLTNGVFIAHILNFGKGFSAALLLLSLGIIGLILIIHLTSRLIEKLNSTPISRTARDSPSRREAGTLLAIFIGVSIFTIPYLWGWCESKRVLEDESRHARVTIRQDADRPTIRLPYPAILIGTTSEFHFFYKCIKKNERDWKCRGENEIKEERVFTVPTANLSSLEFISEPEKPPSQVGLPELVTAIKELDLSPKEINVNVSGFGNHCEFGWKKSEPVGPFCESEHDRLENDKQTDCKDDKNSLISLAALEEKLSRKFQDHTLQQLMLIGRADIKPLRGQKLQDYGSNSGLAQARAKWVWKSLERKAKIDPDRVILLSAGPLHTGSEAEDPKNREHDRIVEVYACWAPKPEQDSSSADSGG